MSDDDVHVRRLGEARRYAVRDEDCSASACFTPDILEYLDGTIAWGCAHRVLHGCPDVLEIKRSETLRDKRKREGWRPA